MKKQKYPQLKELFYTDKNAYQREWRKLNPSKYVVRDEWRKLDNYKFDELPSDIIPVPDFPTYYVRPNGEVWRDTRGTESAIKTGKEHVLKLRSTYIPKNGYWIVQPYKEGKRKAIYLHRFILTAFKGPAPKHNMECHHIDNNTSNNSISNLMWVTRQENINYSHHNMMGPKITLEQGRKVSKSKHSNKFPIIIELVKQEVSVRKIAEMLNLEKGAVYQIIRQLKRRGQL